MSYFPTQFALNPFTAVSGNFTLSGYGSRYIWSGVSTSWTGTLASPSILSGAQMSVINVSTGAPLFLTGSVFYGLNYTLQPRTSVVLWSEGSTWLPLT